MKYKKIAEILHILLATTSFLDIDVILIDTNLTIKLLPLYTSKFWLTNKLIQWRFEVDLSNVLLYFCIDFCDLCKTYKIK